MNGYDDEVEESPLERLTLKQRRFCEAYVGEAKGVGVEAARLAGYNGDDATLTVIASQNLRKPDIAAVLADLTESDPLVAGRLERLRMLSEIARGKATDEKLDKDGCRVEVRVDAKARLAAIEALTKAAGEHISKSEVAVSGLPEGLTPAQLLELASAGKRQGA